MSDKAFGETLREIIREEVGPRFDAVGEQLGSLENRLEALEKRVVDGFAKTDEQFEWTEEQFEWVGQRFDAIDQQFADLKKMLVGVVDEDYPPIDQQRKRTRSRSPLAPSKMAAKGGS